jgi:alkylation response protein AidB-like acyl-CoA dehydrogenase
MWKKMANLGWMGLVFPEEHGGSGGEFLDLIILLEEMGYNILPGPFFSTVVLCSLPILQFGTKEQKERFLPKIANGALVLALSLTEPSATYKPSGIEVKATLKDGNYLIEGTKLFVSDAHVADYLLVAARASERKNPEEGITLFLVDAKSPGVKIEVVPTTAWDKQCEVIFEGVKVPEENILGEIDKGWKIVDWTLQRAAICKCAEMIGGCKASLEMANSYARERIVYGRPIADFQAIQYYLVNMWINTETSKNITYEVAWTLGENLPCTKDVSIAKAYVSEAFKFVTERGVQIHGAIGTTRDHDMGLYYRRAWAWDPVFGDADFHREIIAQEIGL